MDRQFKARRTDEENWGAIEGYLAARWLGHAFSHPIYELLVDHAEGRQYTMLMATATSTLQPQIITWEEIDRGIKIFEDAIKGMRI